MGTAPCGPHWLRRRRTSDDNQISRQSHPFSAAWLLAAWKTALLSKAVFIAGNTNLSCRRKSGIDPETRESSRPGGHRAQKTTQSFSPIWSATLEHTRRRPVPIFVKMQPSYLVTWKLMATMNAAYAAALTPDPKPAPPPHSRRLRPRRRRAPENRTDRGEHHEAKTPPTNWNARADQIANRNRVHALSRMVADGRVVEPKRRLQYGARSLRAVD